MDYKYLYWGELPEYVRYLKNDISDRLKAENIDPTIPFTVYFIPISTLRNPSGYPVLHKNDDKNLYIYIYDRRMISEKNLPLDTPKYYGVLTIPSAKYALKKELLEITSCIKDAAIESIETGLLAENFNMEVMMCADGRSVYDHVKSIIEIYRNKSITWSELIETCKGHTLKSVMNYYIITTLVLDKEDRRIITDYEKHNLDADIIRLIRASNMIV